MKTVITATFMTLGVWSIFWWLDCAFVVNINPLVPPGIAATAATLQYLLGKEKP